MLSFNQIANSLICCGSIFKPILSASITPHQIHSAFKQKKNEQTFQHSISVQRMEFARSPVCFAAAIRKPINPAAVCVCVCVMSANVVWASFNAILISFYTYSQNPSKSLVVFTEKHIQQSKQSAASNAIINLRNIRTCNAIEIIHMGAT